MPDPTISVIIDAYTRGLQDGMKQAEDSVKSASASMTASLANLNQAAMLMQRTFTDMVGIVRQVYDLGKEGAQLQNVERRFYRLAGGAEEAEKILVRLRAATKGTATDAELMDGALRLMSSGLARTTGDLETIMKTVPALGAQMKGFGADRSLLSYTFMISNGLKSVEMRADDFGISVTTVESRMKQLEASGMATRDALQQAVNEELIRVYDDLGLSAKTVADEMTANEAAITNTVNALKRDFVPLSASISEGFAVLVEKFSPVVEYIIGGIGHILAGLSGFAAGLGKAIETTISFGHIIRSALSGNLEEAQRNAQAWLDNSGQIFTAARDEMLRYYAAWEAKTQTTSDDVVDSTNSANEAIGGLTENQRKFAEETKKAMDKVAEAWEKTLVRNSRWAADNALAELRRIEDQQIAAARQTEDMGRQLSASIAGAQAQAAQAEVEAARNYAKRKLDIERNYQQRLKEIQASYQESATDAIRRRDALALVRAGRQRDKELKDADAQRQEQHERAKEDYAEQLRNVKESLQQQIEAANETYAQQQEDLRRSLQRQEEDAQRSQQRRIEDQARALAREMQDIIQSTAAKVAALREHYKITETDYMAHLIRMRIISQMINGLQFGKPSSAPPPSLPAGTSRGTPGALGTQIGQSQGLAEGTPYVPTTGTYLLHQGERVVPAQENKMRPAGTAGMRRMERMTIQIDQSGWGFSGSFSDREKEWYRRTAYEQAEQAVVNVVGGLL